MFSGNSKQKSFVYCVIPEHIATGLRPGILNEKTFKQIWPMEDFPEKETVKLSIGLVIVAPRYNSETDTVEALLIRERNSHNPYHLTVKFPSGAMEIEDKDVFSGVVREFRTETGYEARGIQFCFAGEYSSTVADERHIKMFFIATEHEEVGSPTEKDILDAFWHPFKKIGKSMMMPNNQRVILPKIQDKIMSISREMAFGLLNNDAGPTLMEGEVE